MVSFDVLSLVTNLAFVKTIDIITDGLYDEQINNSIRIPKNIFEKLMLLATQGIFMQSKRLQKQVERIVMGSPFVSTMAKFLHDSFRRENLCGKVYWTTST